MNATSFFGVTIFFMATLVMPTLMMGYLEFRDRRKMNLGFGKKKNPALA
jgi:hypothetical protein